MFRRFYPVVYLVCILSVLLIFVLPHLSLPFYWDEAWPYRVAVEIMNKHGLSLSPAAIPSFESRGHPVMFHFLAASWIRIFSNSVLSLHCFAFSVTATTIVGIYAYCSRFFNNRVAMFASLLFAIQPITIAQACFLLPEMMMAMWVIWAFYAWSSGYKFLFIVLTAAMLLTKESGVVFVGALGLYEIAGMIVNKTISVKTAWSRLWPVVTAVMLAFIYFVLQKMIYGWFLYPFYMDHIASHSSSILSNLTAILTYMFIYYSRNGIVFSVIVCVAAGLFYRKLKFEDRQRKSLNTMLAFLLLFILFSAVNYYIPRYLLCAFPFYIIVCTVLIEKVLHPFRAYYVLLSIGLVLVCAYAYLENRPGRDCDYGPLVRVDREVVHLCEQMNLSEKHIMAPCNIRFDLTFPETGYLQGKPFSHLTWDCNAETEYCIFNAGEYEPAYEQLKNDGRMRLIKRFEDGYAWSELYEIKKVAK